MEKSLVLPYLSLAWATVHAMDTIARRCYCIVASSGHFDFQIGVIGGVMSENITIGSDASAQH